VATTFCVTGVLLLDWEALLLDGEALGATLPPTGGTDVGAAETTP
jgi:hypothetical protein